MFGDLFDESPSKVATVTKSHGQSNLEPPPRRGSTGFCGIKNQGATCYLNSLIQTLLLTPELREELFRLGPAELGNLEDVTKHNVKTRKIPIQLQMLLARLLMLDQNACGTEALTNSFGWVDSEQLQQHDVQELSRILFCAIEDSLVGTTGHSIIKKLYRGTTANIITCLTCGNVSETLEDFLDLNIAIATRDDLVLVLRDMFAETELMNGKNQYQCENCKKLVDARKGAVIKSLPPILTISLLRFSFNYRSLRRFKETKRFEFPLTLNMKTFCGKAENKQENSCYDYDLYSVIIHSGSAHGGHYRAFIRDVDGLGTVPANYDPAPKASLSNSFNKSHLENEIEDPLAVLSLVLVKLGGSNVPLNKLGEALREETGTSWAKQYRKKYGTMTKFLQGKQETFVVNSKSKTVSLRTSKALEDQLANHEFDYFMNSKNDEFEYVPGEYEVKDDSSHIDSDISKSFDASMTNSLTDYHVPDCDVSNDVDFDKDFRPLCNVWFDFNDSTISPITTCDIKQQYEGKESAYMLFYRRRDLKRPLESLGNRNNQLPDHIREVIESENEELEKKRFQYELSLTMTPVQIFFPSMFQIANGLMRLKNKDGLSNSGLPHSVGTEASLAHVITAMKKIAQSHDDELTDNVQCNVIKTLPHGGIHVYEQIVYSNSITVKESSIENNQSLLLWNGATIGGTAIIYGSDNEPVVLHVECKNMGVGLVHSLNLSGVVPSSVKWIDLKNCLLTTHIIDPSSTSGKFAFKTTEGGLEYFEHDLNKSLGEIHSSYEKTLVVDFGLESSDRGQCMDSATYDVYFSENLLEKLKNHKSTDKVFNVFQKKLSVSIPDTMPIADVKSSISRWMLSNTNTNFTLHNLHLYLEVAHTSNSTQKIFKLPLQDGHSFSEIANPYQSTCLKLEIGSPPEDWECHVMLYIQKGSKIKLPVKFDHGIQAILDKSLTVEKNIVKQFANKFDNDDWYFRCLKNEKEAGEILTCLGSTLEKTPINHGSSLLIFEGAIPTEGHIRIPVWYYPRKPSLQNIHLLNVESGEENDDATQQQPYFISYIDIEKDSTLFDLKRSIAAIQFFKDKSLTSESICLRSISQKLPTRFHLQDTAIVKRLRLGVDSPLAVQSWDKPPDIAHCLVLTISFHDIGSRNYGKNYEYICKTPITLLELLIELADVLHVEADKIIIANQSDCGMWEATQHHEMQKKDGKQKQGSKKSSKSRKAHSKVRNKKSSISSCLRNGDVIRVKLIDEESDSKEKNPEILDFLDDEELKAYQKAEDAKRISAANTRNNSSDGDCIGSLQMNSPIDLPKKDGCKSNKEETLHIYVDKF